MWRPNIRNHTFDWMGEKFAPLIDRDHFLGHSAIGNLKHNIPLVNFKKEGYLFEMEVAVPGFAKDELEILVKDDILTIKGEKRGKKMETSQYILEEFDTDSFERRFRLGEGIGHEKITARYENGLLVISFSDVPKEEEKMYQEVEVV